MSNQFVCPFCSTTVALTDDTHKTSKTYSYLKTSPINNGNGITSYKAIDEMELYYRYCPSCEKVAIKAMGIGSQFQGKVWNIFPDSNAKQLPEYIPSAIVQDYEEACKIVNLSPKSSATLSRRCLQGMIRDYWNVSKNSLLDEINAISGKVDPETSDVLHSIRKIGNIGAHPERDINLVVDIEEGEAQDLLLFLEYLFDEWYIKRHDRKSMLARIKDLSTSKQEARKKN